MAHVYAQLPGNIAPYSLNHGLSYTWRLTSFAQSAANVLAAFYA